MLFFVSFSAGDGQYPASGTAAGSGNSYDYSQYLDASTVYWQAAGNYAQQSMGWQGQGYEQSVAGYAAQYAQQQQQQQQQESEAYVPPQADVAHGQQPVASEQPHLDDGSYALVGKLLNWLQLSLSPNIANSFSHLQNTKSHWTLTS